jgi:hypothetical protein
VHPNTGKTSTKAWGLVPQPENIPKELKELDRWNAWRAKERRNRPGWDKIPAGGASTRNLAEWVDFDTAWESYSTNTRRMSGVCLCLTNLDRFVVIDLDKCVRWKDGDWQLRPWARELVDVLGTYTEVSPSGTGLRLFLFCTQELIKEYSRHDQHGIDLYTGASPRHVTMTGVQLPNTVEYIKAATYQDLELLESYRPLQDVTRQDLPEGSESVPELPPAPDLLQYNIHQDTLRELATRFTGRDRSDDLTKATRDLLLAGMTNEQALAVLLNSPAALEVAHDHWHASRADVYLWRHHVLRQRVYVPEGLTDSFDDLTQDDETDAHGGVWQRQEDGLDIIRLHPDDSPLDLPPRDWVCYGVALKGYLSVVTGSGGVAKSTWTLALALSIAAGKDVIGLGIKEEQRPVLLINNEDDEIEMRRRVWSVCLQFDIRYADICDYVDIHSGYGKGLQVVQLTETSKQGRKAKLSPQASQIGRMCKARDYELVVMDPLVTLHDANENDNGEMQQVADKFKQLAGRYHQAVIIVHHVRKGGLTPGDVDAGRGASAIPNAARIGITCTRPDEKAINDLGLDPSRDYLQVVTGKSNYSPRSTDGWWYRLDSVDLGQGDAVGVTVPVDIEEARQAAQGVQDESNWLMAGAEAMVEARMPVGDVEALLAVQWDKPMSKVRGLFTVHIPHGHSQAVVVRDDWGSYKLWKEREDERNATTYICRRAV